MDRWITLLQWAKQNGMTTGSESLLVRIGTSATGRRGLFLTRDAPPSTKLFKIPPNIMLNIETLAPLYPELYRHPRQDTRDDKLSLQKLTATQLLTLHLLLHCIVDGNSSDPTFGPYLDILPRHFRVHPLTWRFDLESNPLHNTLWNILPPGLKAGVDKQLEMFSIDRKAVGDVLVQHPHYLIRTRCTLSQLRTDLDGGQSLITANYMIAWLNVNTRSVYYRLKSDQGDADNVTLCPILDLVNHHCDARRATTSDPIPVFMSPSGVSLKEGDEIFSRYGSHSNRFLFVHYGFVWSDMMELSVDVDDVFDQVVLFPKSTESREQIKSLLQEFDYWRSWTFHTSEDYGYPSYRILPALRLACLEDSELQSKDSTRVHAWRRQVAGLESWEEDEDGLIGRNVKWESEMMDQLVGMCDWITKRGEEGLLATEAVRDRLGQGEGEDRLSEYAYAVDCTWHLWNEEVRVARAIRMSIEAGESFW